MNKQQLLEWQNKWNEQNNSGNGYAGLLEGVEDEVKRLVNMGAECLVPFTTNCSIAVLRLPNGNIIGIADANGSWRCDLS